MAFDPEKEITTRCAALIKAVNDGMEAYYKKAEKSNPIKVRHISLKIGVANPARTPVQQAESILGMHSWTCAGPHMTVAARDLEPWYGDVKVGHLYEMKIDKDKVKKKLELAAYKEFVSLMNANMTTQDLRNFDGGGKGFLSESGDPLHMELPNSRLKINDKRVVKCLTYYADATRKKKRKKNTAFETTKGPKDQIAWLKDYDKKNAGAGATIVGWVKSNKPKLHDAKDAWVVLKIKKSGVAMKTKLASLKKNGVSSSYEMTKIPEAPAGTYVLSVTYKNKALNKNEKSEKEINAPVASGKSYTFNIEIK